MFYSWILLFLLCDFVIWSVHGAPFLNDPNTIPGLFQLERFDTPGLSNSKYTGTSTVTTAGYRTDTNVPIAALTNSPRLFYVSLAPSSYVVFSVSNITAGDYKVFVSSCRTTYSGSLHLMFNRSNGVSFVLDWYVPYNYYYCASTGDSTYANAENAKSLTLPADITSLTVRAVDGTINADYVLILPAAQTASSVSNTIPSFVYLKDFNDGWAFQRVSAPNSSAAMNSSYRNPRFFHDLSQTPRGDALMLGSYDYYDYFISTSSSNLFVAQLEIQGAVNNNYYLGVYLNSSDMGSWTYTASGGAANASFFAGMMFYFPVGRTSFRLTLTSSHSALPFLYFLNFTSVNSTMFEFAPNQLFPAEKFFSGSSSRTTTPKYRTDAKLVQLSGSDYRLTLQAGESATFKLVISTAGNYDLGFGACGVSYSYDLLHAQVSIGGTVKKSWGLTNNGCPTAMPLLTSADQIVQLGYLTAGTHQITLSGVGSQGYSYIYNTIDTLLVLPTRGAYASNSIPGTIYAKNFDDGFSFVNPDAPFLLGNSTYRKLVLPLYDDPASGEQVLKLRSGMKVEYTLTTTIYSTFQISITFWAKSSANFQVLINGGVLLTIINTTAGSGGYITATSSAVVGLRADRSNVITLVASSSYTYDNTFIKSFTFTGVTTFTPRSISRTTLPATIQAIDFYDANNSVAVNQGNSTIRMDSSVDISGTSNAPSTDKASITLPDNDEVITYHVYSPYNSFYDLSLTLLPPTGSISYGTFSVRGDFASGNILSTYHAGQGYLSSYRGVSMNGYGPYPFDVIFIPQGNQTIYFRSDLQSSTPTAYRNGWFFNQFTFTELRRAFSRVTFPGAIEGEDFDIILDTPKKTWTNAANDTSYRTDNSHSVFVSLDGLFRFAYCNISTPLTYVAYIPSGESFSVRVNAWSASAQYVTLTVGRSAPTGTLSTQTSLSSFSFYVYGVRQWYVLSSSMSTTSITAGYYSLTLTATYPFYVDYISFFPNSGPYNGVVGSIPGTLLSWQYDYESYYDSSSGNSGSVRNIRQGDSTDFGLDSQGSTALVNIDSSERITFTVDVVEGPVDVYITAETFGTSYLNILINGTYYFGRLVLPNGGTYVDTYAGTVNMVYGRSTISFYFSSSTSTWKSFTKIRFETSTYTQAKPFTTGPLVTGVIRATEYDYGGNGVAYQSGSRYSQSNVRSLDTTSESYYYATQTYGITIDSVTTWVQYTFEVSWPALTRVLLTARTNNYYSYVYFTISLIDYTSKSILQNVTVGVKGTSQSVVNLGEFLFNVGTKYTFRAYFNETSYYSAILDQFSFSVATTAFQDASCYQKSTIEAMGCNTSTVSTISSIPCQGSFFTGMITYPDVSTTSIKYCPRSFIGVAETFTSPSSSEIYKGVTMLFRPILTKARYSSAIRSGNWRVGSVLVSNDFAEVVLVANGLEIRQFKGLNGQKTTIFTQTGTCSTSASQATFSNGVFQVTTSAGCCVLCPQAINQYYRPNYMFLDGCSFVLTGHNDPPTWSTSYYAHYSFVYNSAGCKNVTNSPYNKFEVVRSDGIAFKLGAMAFDHSQIGSNVDFLPRGQFQAAPASPVCTGVNITAQSVSSTALRPTQELGVLTIVFPSPMAARSVRLLTFDNLDWPEVAGVAWIVNSTSCSTGYFTSLSALNNMAYGLRFDVSSWPSPDSVTDNPRACAVLCETTASCLMFATSRAVM